ncbi:type II toxin-antitoxin system PemK/MazF family toxin [Microcoleus sp. herbarium12]
MRRGEVYDLNLEPVQGSEQGGTRPAIIVNEGAERKRRFSRVFSQYYN